MRENRFLASLLLVATIITMFPTRCEAHEGKVHDEFMKRILFGKDDYTFNSESSENFDVLAAACYLTIDYCNSNKKGETELAILRNYGIKKLPSLRKINYSAQFGQHREYTHLGWEQGYSKEHSTEMEPKWADRRNILKNTVKTVFNFKKNDNQKDAFCKLLYYIHILGDHEDSKISNLSNDSKGTVVAGLINISAKRGEKCIISELLGLLPDLFPDQVNTHKYRELKKDLGTINRNLNKLVNSTGGINTDEKIEQYKQLVEELINKLSSYLPEMLKDEPFFHEAFYEEPKQSVILDFLDGLFNAA